MIVYRITKSKYASNISGNASALYPGRWNKKGTPVLYTSENKEIALLEIIVHTPPLMVPKLSILTLEIPDDSLSELKELDLPKNWHQFPAPTILSELGQNWIDEDKTIGLKVPSCIIHTSHNIILNCKHRDYQKLRVLSQTKFYFDTRLKK